MARTKQTRANAAPGAGMIFALRAIGLVIFARWLFSMSNMDVLTALSAMASSPWACINLVFLFLLIFLPGARARVERPFHPLPQWLRQALRLFAFLGFLFAAWSVGAFAWTAGLRRAAHAVAATNGWLLAAPALYAAVLWICRPRALWRTNTGARRFAIGRYAISIDNVTRTAVVWMESRKLGQYDARELSVRWPGGVIDGGSRAAKETPGGDAKDAAGSGLGAVPVAAAPDIQAQRDAAFDTREAQTDANQDNHVGADTDAAARGVDGQHTAEPPATAPVASREPAIARATSMAPPRHTGPGGWLRRPKIELMWDSPAAAGHNRQTVFRVSLVSEGDRTAARALDASLRQAG
ncbi:hypothetical protein [Paraburkholderia rhizosphaerae]|uniref:Uncharacterized protein n=1 Tax=Paraburkholderia rhizosphaerae TaxID=480658 RepID=A0A4R8LN88_9BURK|nr:hypothetical protein [Paraburkholderia rhizosphaerae]TDY47728.1 hypothetical protein BX592_112116 [Paraburkholderia rhizosphaerae]